MSRYEKLWAEQRYTLLMVGLAMAILGAAISDQNLREQKLLGYLFALGIGVLLGIPPKNANFNLFHRRSREVIWTILDLAMRLALIAAVELVLRQLDVRYAFKARVAAFALLGIYAIHPQLSNPSGKVLFEKFAQHYQAFCGGVGLLLVAAAFSLRDSLIVPLPELIGACGLGLAAGSTCNYLADLIGSRYIWPMITLMVIGLLATGVITFLVAGLCSILCLLVYFVAAIASITITDPKGLYNH